MADYNPATVAPAPESDFVFDPITRTIEKYVGNIPSTEWMQLRKGTTVESYAKLAVEHKDDDLTMTLRVPDTIQGVPVLGIAEKAFMYCGAAEIILPDTVTHIESFAFREAALHSLRLPRDLSVFHPCATIGCWRLSQVTIAPANWHFTINDNLLMDKSGTDVLAYLGCDTSTGECVVIPEGVTTIGPGVFAYRLFQSIILPRSLKEIQDAAFAHAHVRYGLILPYGLKRIGAHAFDHFKSWRNFDCLLPNAMEIDDYAFAFCSIDNVLLSDSLQCIGTCAFHKTCSSNGGEQALKIYAPMGTLGEQFARQNQLEYHVVTDSPAFAHLREYTPELEVGQSYAREADFTTEENTIGSFSYAYITGYKGKETRLHIPPIIRGKEVWGISDGAFQGNHDLEAVWIPEGLNYIGIFAFSGCLWLDSVYLPNSLTDIGEHAFDLCCRMEHFHVKPAGVKYDSNVFKDCDMLPKEIRKRSPEGIAGVFHRIFGRK